MGSDSLDIVLPGGARVPLDGPLSLGRGPDNDIQLADPSVSRRHAQLVRRGSGFVIEDAGSSYGTRVDGRQATTAVRVEDGSLVSLGDFDLRVERRSDRGTAGQTIFVAPGASAVVPALGASHRSNLAGSVGERPRLRSGYALKRLDQSEGEYRFVLKDLRTNTFMRLREPEAELAKRMDGNTALDELIRMAEGFCGANGAGRLARLLADLADHELLAGVEPRRNGDKGGLLARLVEPRARELPRADAIVTKVYEHGGHLLFTRSARAAVSSLAVLGLIAFVALIVARYGTPFVVARKVGLGALVFVAGRFLVVAFHELAHGLTLVSVGRRVTRAGLKRVLVFPYAFLDTSDAWFEPRRRRIAVSLAGPISDLTVGGAFAVACLLAEPGEVRDILFQLAFAGYVGALFNINPLLERDGYHVLVDLLRQPCLRRRSRQALSDLLSGRNSPTKGSQILVPYAMFSVAWSILTVAFAIVMSTRYYHQLATLAPRPLVWTVLASFYLLLILPVAFQLVRPLWERQRASPKSEGSLARA